MAPRKPPAKRIRASSRSTIPPVPPEDGGTDDDPEDDTPPIDQQLSLFVRKPPSAADRLVVVAQSNQGDQIVQERSATEIRQGSAHQYANDLIALCERWSRTEGREVRFRGTWQAGERVLGSYAWKAGTGDPLALDGTVESMLMQMQRHIESRDRQALEERNQQGQQWLMLKDGWNELLKSAFKRIAELEAQLSQATERLKKAGDVDAEIAITTTAATLQQKERFADIVEQRLMPLLQAMAVRYVNGSVAAAAPPLAAVAAAAPLAQQGPQPQSAG